MEGLNNCYGRGLDYVVVAGSFRPNGASGVVSDSQKGTGWTVARTSEGLYTVTFDEKWPAKTTGRKGPGLIAFVANARTVSSGVIVNGSVVNQANRTAQIIVSSGPWGLDANKGFLPLDITALREIAGNVIQDLAAHGGLLASDSVPALERINGATDKALRVDWAKTEVDEVQFPPIAYPPDLDPTADVTVHLLVSKDANTDTAAVIDIQAWEGIGDTEFGGNSDALDVAADTLLEVSTTLAAANISGHGSMLNLGLVPGAHANDAVRVHAAWLEYTKKSVTDLAADADNEIDFIAILQDNLEGG